MSDGASKSNGSRKLRSYALGEWVEGTGKPTELFHAVTGEKVAEANSEGLDFKAMLEYGRKNGGSKLQEDDLPRARRAAQADGEVSDGSQGRVLSGVCSYRRDEGRLLGGCRRRHRDVLRVLAARAVASFRTRRFTSKALSKDCRRTAPSSAGTSAFRSKGPRCTSTRSTSRAGGCSRSSRRHFSPECPR